jgi:site-specific DNA-cytosine methylase
LLHILSALPPLIILENVKELLSPDLDTNSEADVDYIINKLREAGYAIVFWTLNKAEQYGSPAVRWRLYFIAMRVPKTLENMIPELIIIKQKMCELMLAMRIDHGNPLDFIQVYDDDGDETDDDEPAAKQPKVMKYKEDVSSTGP